MSFLALAILGGLVTHPELGVSVELPDGWRFERDCGVFVSPSSQCRLEGKLAACPAKALCPARVGVLWLRAPAVLASVEEEKGELREGDGGASWVTSQPLADGWVLTWGGTSWPDTFPFRVSRRLGARVIECAGEATTLAGQEQMIAACKSLREVTRR